MVRKLKYYFVIVIIFKQANRAF
ncbi:MAG: hypothetical protein FD188_3529, partial [Ignavibacteria bacterium]